MAAAYPFMEFGLHNVSSNIGCASSIEASFMEFGLHNVSRVQRNNNLLEKPRKTPLKSVNCSKLYLIVNKSWNITFFYFLQVMK